MSDVLVDPVQAAEPDGGKRLLLTLGVLGLLVAGIVAAIAIGGSTSSSAGASTPEDAFVELFDALADEDVIGAAELLLPNERETLVQPWFDMVTELKRLEILDPSLDLSAVAGVDLEFEGLEFVVTMVTEDLASVRLTGGISKATYDTEALPIGRLILDRLPDGALPADSGSSLEEIDTSDDGLVAVRRDGRWFISIWYTVAELARIEAGLPLPDSSQAVIARGASSGEDAVEEMIRAAIDLDVRRTLELLAPSEVEVLHEYAPLFLGDAEAAAADARRSMSEIGLKFDLRRLDLSSTGSGSDRIITFDGGELEITSDVADGRIEVSNGSMTAEMVLPEEDVRFKLTVIGDCFELEVRDLSGEVLELDRQCAGDVEQLLEDFVGGDVISGGFPDFDIFATRPEVGIATVEEDGEWFISPFGTLIDAQVDVLAAIDKEKLEELIDWFIDQAESNGLV